MVYIHWQCQSGSLIPPFWEGGLERCCWTREGWSSPARRWMHPKCDPNLCADACQSLRSPMFLPLLLLARIVVEERNSGVALSLPMDQKSRRSGRRGVEGGAMAIGGVGRRNAMPWAMEDFERKSQGPEPRPRLPFLATNRNGAGQCSAAGSRGSEQIGDRRGASAFTLAVCGEEPHHEFLKLFM